jgi:hypothetical protein
MRLPTEHVDLAMLCACCYHSIGMFEGVRSRFNLPGLLPILKQEDVASRIIKAVRRNAVELQMPPIVYTADLLRGIFPASLFDFTVTSGPPSLLSGLAAMCRAVPSVLLFVAAGVGIADSASSLRVCRATDACSRTQAGVLGFNQAMDDFVQTRHNGFTPPVADAGAPGAKL